MTADATPAPLRICMLSDDFVPAATGVGTHLQTIVTLLASRGHAITVVTTRRPGQVPEERWNGARVVRVATVKLFGFFQAVPSMATLSRIMQESHPDIVHHHYLGMMFLRALKVARDLSLAQVYTYHMTEDHLTQPMLMKPFRPLFAKAIAERCNRVDQIISVSRNLAEALRATGIRTPIAYISNPIGFDTEATHPAADDDANRFIVLFVGRLNPEKNLPYLIRGFREFASARPAAELWIIGSGSQLSPLQGLARELKLDARVRFVGQVAHAELPSYYQRCDVFVLPSLVETQGAVALEAMYFAKPLLVARGIVSASELVDDGVNGYLIDETQPEDLARRLASLYGDDALRRRMGAAGKRKARLYEPSGIAAEIEALYRGVLLARHAPAAAPP